MKEMFSKPRTWILGTLMGIFFTYIGTTVYIPITRGMAVVPGEAVELPPSITIVFTIIEIILVFFGMLTGLLLTRQLKKRRTVMMLGGFSAAVISVASQLPVIHDNMMLVNISKSVTVFLLCICLVAWTYTINEVELDPNKRGMQIGAILSLAAIMGSITPMVQAILIELELFQWSWLGVNVLLLGMGICGYLSPESYRVQQAS